jgi:hypothetical protein
MRTSRAPLASPLHETTMSKASQPELKKARFILLLRHLCGLN